MANNMYNGIGTVASLMQNKREGERVEIIVKYNGSLDEVARELNADIEILDENYAIITLPSNEVEALYQFKEIEYVELPKRLSYALSEELSSSCITEAFRNEYDLSGEGVLVAVIDSGIDYTHTDFRNRDGTTRIVYIWDQTIVGIPPAGFKSGTEYTREQIDLALQNEDPYSVVPHRDEEGHGTSVAGVAAGNGNTSGGLQKGVAPEASIIVVKLGENNTEPFARTTEIMRAIKYVIDKAIEWDMPVAINISFGTNDGAHNGDSLFETYVDEMANKWKTVIAVASGNEGSAGHHFAGRVERGETVDVDFKISLNSPFMYVTFWKNFVDNFEVELIAPNGTSSGVLDPNRSFARIVLQGVAIDIYNVQPNNYNDYQETLAIFNTTSTPFPEGIWRIRVRGVDVVDGNFNIWLPTVEEVTTDTAFLNPNILTTLTLPSTSQNVITVGGYNSRLNSAANFSGRGYTVDKIYVKPDIVAPAVGVVTTHSGGGYDSFSGTSVATPFVTGSAALMMEWGIVRGNDAFLYGQRVKAFLKKGARRNPNMTYPNPSWGYGSLCLKDTFNHLVYYAEGRMIIT